jgi:hypothetical protein
VATGQLSWERRRLADKNKGIANTDLFQQSSRELHADAMAAGETPNAAYFLFLAA